MDRKQTQRKVEGTLALWIEGKSEEAFCLVNRRPVKRAFCLVDQRQADGPLPSESFVN